MLLCFVGKKNSPKTISAEAPLKPTELAERSRWTVSVSGQILTVLQIMLDFVLSLLTLTRKKYNYCILYMVIFFL